MKYCVLLFSLFLGYSPENNSNINSIKNNELYYNNNVNYYADSLPFNHQFNQVNFDLLQVADLSPTNVLRLTEAQKIYSTKLVELHARFCKGTSASNYSSVIPALQNNPIFKPVIGVPDAYETTYEKQKYVVMVVDKESCQVMSPTRSRKDLEKFNMAEINAQLSLMARRSINTLASIYEAGDGSEIDVFVTQYFHGNDEGWFFSYPNPLDPDSINPDSVVAIATSKLEDE